MITPTKIFLSLLWGVLLLFLLAVSDLGASAHARPLVFTTADNQDHHRAQAMNEVLTTCFKRLGFTLQIVSLPSKRSLHDVDIGLYDGNFVRTRGIPAAYPNLVLVPEPIAINRITAFSRDRSIKVDGWKSLLPYRVAWVRGWRNCERELGNAKSTEQLASEYLLFRFLEIGRADVGVFGLETGTEVLAELGITDVYPLSPPIVESDLFLYMNAKYTDLIPAIVASLRDMKADGTFQVIIDKHYGQNAPVFP